MAEEEAEDLIRDLAAKAVNGRQTEVWEYLRTLPEDRKKFLLMKVRQKLLAQRDLKKQAPGEEGADSNGDAGAADSNGDAAVAKAPPQPVPVQEDSEPVGPSDGSRATNPNDVNQSISTFDFDINVDDIDFNFAGDPGAAEPEPEPEAKPEPEPEPEPEANDEDAELEAIRKAKEERARQEAAAQASQPEASPAPAASPKGKNESSDGASAQLRDLVTRALAGETAAVADDMAAMNPDDRVTLRKELRMLLSTASLLHVEGADDLDVQVRKFLENADALEVAEVFASEGFNMDAVLKLSEDDLKALGVEKIGVRKRLVAAIEAHDGAASTALMGSNAGRENVLVTRIDHNIWNPAKAPKRRFGRKKKAKKGKE